MEITEVSIDSIFPYAFNNRKHSETQVSRIAKSIKDFGFNQPIVIDEDNEILVGHGRYFASKKLGLEFVPTVKIENLSKTDKKAYRILDNKLQNDSEWDLENLALELDSLKENDFDLLEWGLDDLLPEDEQKQEVKEDDYNGETPEDENVFVKLGDLIELDSHRVLCGDSTEESNYKILIDNQEIDLLLTDPPYGVSYSDKNTFLNAFDEGNRNQSKIENDELDPESLKQFIFNCFSILPKYLKDVSSYYCFMPQGGDQMMMMMIALNDSGFQVKHELIWLKNNHVLGRADYNYKHEPICYGWKKEGTHKFYGDFSTSILEFDKPTSSKEHPTMKPIALIARLISNSSVKDSCVLDPFLGSGTTLIASDQLNRTCYGMEISPKYCQVIINRFIKYKPDAVIKINGEVVENQFFNM